MSWVIRDANDDDAAPLSELAERTFRDTFAAMNTAKDMDLFCQRTWSPERQLKEIRSADRKCFVIESEGRLVAYSQIAHGRTPSGRGPAVEIGRFYVDRPFHGQGMAQALMDRVVRYSIESGAKVLWLGVWEKNPRALAFYRKAGFTQTGSQKFVLGMDIQRDLVFERPLDAPER
jgi:ribosomal protein S18 acetylase RimI-like enzyme